MVLLAILRATVPTPEWAVELVVLPVAAMEASAVASLVVLALPLATSAVVLTTLHVIARLKL